ncbi:hypothetical protein GGS20DRAFT_328124 [Poronia punctata]|nr:hypothetical protein GGS20DRAFT_328124 [Poronia punctata]
MLTTWCKRTVLFAFSASYSPSILQSLLRRRDGTWAWASIHHTTIEKAERVRRDHCKNLWLLPNLVISTWRSLLYRIAGDALCSNSLNKSLLTAWSVEYGACLLRSRSASWYVYSGGLRQFYTLEIVPFHGVNRYLASLSHETAGDINIKLENRR